MYGGTRLTSVIDRRRRQAECELPPVWLEIAEATGRSRATRAPTTSACASRTGRATASAYSRSAPSDDTGDARPAIASSSTKRMFSNAPRCRCV